MSHRIAVFDLETDPFEHGKFIEPFVAGFYDGDTFSSWWADNCVERFISFLAGSTDTYTIYAHNGGRFDFFYLIKYIERELRIVNGRIIQAWIGEHELRDSFAIMPFALEKYNKTPIDYQKFKRHCREKHRTEITSYLKDDCTDLHKLVTTFVGEFGNALTIGSASMKQLKKFHSFETGNGLYDAKFRKDFFFGGRNQVFKAGISHGTINVYDVNSMYPSVMRNYLHPVSIGIYIGDKIDAKTAFVSVEGRNYGAFPVRQKNNSLDFTTDTGIYHTTIHEFNAALETGTFRPKRIHKTYGFDRRESFAEFVDHFYNARNNARADNDKIRTLFYKFVLNSGYGKFAQNPSNYSDWYITQVGELPPTWHECGKACDDPCVLRWSPAFISGNDYIIWSKPLKEHHYFNIATGASITGASRAVLLHGLSKAVKPMYCDTDSIICEHLHGVSVSDSDLGSWKLEATGTHAAICGKKLYAIWDGDTGIKKAHKGAILTYDEIWSIAHGNTVESANPVPSFKWDGSHTFTKRNIRRTA